MDLKSILEAILFASQKALSPNELRKILGDATEHSQEPLALELKKTKTDDIEAALAELAKEVQAANRSYGLVCVAGGWQYVSLAEYAPWLKALAGERARPPRLSQPALETLTIIAYRQPLTRAEIEQIRGVSVDGVMQTLLDRNLVEQVGRADVVGRPMMYGTTKAFLEYFGLRALEELPAADELRRIPVERPPKLVTVEGSNGNANGANVAGGEGAASAEPAAAANTTGDAAAVVAGPAADADANANANADADSAAGTGAGAGADTNAGEGAPPDKS